MSDISFGSQINGLGSETLGNYRSYMDFNAPQDFGNINPTQLNSSVVQNIPNNGNTAFSANDKAYFDAMRSIMSQQMAFNSAEAQKTRDWQTELSNTAHQREVQDLIKAGINPILTATGGTGASVGSASSASYQESGSGLLGAIINQNSALQVAKLNNDTKRDTAFLDLIGNLLGTALRKA